MSSPRYKDGRATTSASIGYNAHKFHSTWNNMPETKNVSPMIPINVRWSGATKQIRCMLSGKSNLIEKLW
jgi:hypothetical protein